MQPEPILGMQARMGCCAADAAPLLDVRDAWDTLVARRAGNPRGVAPQGLPRAHQDSETWESAGAAQTRRRRTEIALSTLSERVLGRPLNKAMQCAPSSALLRSLFFVRRLSVHTGTLPSLESLVCSAGWTEVLHRHMAAWNLPVVKMKSEISEKKHPGCEVAERCLCACAHAHPRRHSWGASRY